MLFLAAANLAWPARAQDSLEYPVKAAYLYKFAPFITWPSSAFENSLGQVTLCIVGTDPFGGVLDQAVAGQQVGARAIAVRRLKGADSAAGCEIMYVGGSDPKFIARALASVHGKPVLTVTDVAIDAPQHGIINFVIDNNHVRFDIDELAATENGLTISSKLLGLARAVKESEP